MLRALSILTFLALAAENYAEQPFHGMWSTPFRPIGDLLFKATPVKAPGVAVMILICLAVARGKASARRDRAAPLDRALWAQLIAMAGLLVWGLLGGGSMLSALIQIQVFVFLPITAFMFIATLQTEEQFLALGKVVLYGALYRATLVIFFYFFIAPTLEYVPPTMTTHSDTVLFVAALVAVISWAIEQRDRKATLRCILLSAYLLVAVQLNNRRLAYVSLGASLIVLYLLLQASDLKRAINRRLLLMSPIIAVYLAVGWGSSNPLFAPAKALSSIVGEKQDASAKTRDIENYNLIVTLRDQKLIGSGWGHPYNEVSVAYSVSDAFPIYRYVPHNTVLGIWAFAGYVGSTALWVMFVVGTFLGLRAYRFAETPLARTIAACSVCVVIIYAMQAYGDMGIMAWNANFIVGLGFAGASRMAVASGAYPSNTPA